MAYVTVGVITVLICSTLPEYDSRVEHAESFLSTLSRRGGKFLNSWFSGAQGQAQICER